MRLCGLDGYLDLIANLQALREASLGKQLLSVTLTVTVCPEPKLSHATKFLTCFKYCKIPFKTDLLYPLLAETSHSI